VIRDFGIEQRLTICNMSIEAGARAGMIAPDEKTFAYLRGRAMAPKGALWDQAVAYWRTLPTDDDAVFDKELMLDGQMIAPMVSWGTSPQMTTAISGRIPQPNDAPDADMAGAIRQALDY